MRREPRVGLDYLEAITSLLQRRRIAHPTKGTYEAAELQWWWTIPRPTDEVRQPFWFDDDGPPLAAAILVDFTIKSSAIYEEVTFCPFVLPDAAPEFVAEVVDEGLRLAAANNIATVELEVDQADHLLRSILKDRGFSIREEGVLVEAWLEANAAASVSQLDPPYRLASRAETAGHPHHMADPSRPMIEERLRQASLYDPELDLVILDGDNNPAAYGLFWYDQATATGVVEPMRTSDEHQQKGLARHLLTSGIDRLAKAGASRISIGYEPDNPASGHLYRSVGFQPTTKTDSWTGSTNRTIVFAD